VDDELSHWLRREGTCGRWEQIHADMASVFQKFVAEQAPRRVQASLEAAENLPLPAGVAPRDADTIRRCIAWSTAIAEGVLVATALYLARHEPPAASGPRDAS
jgi:hypothetical protein